MHKKTYKQKVRMMHACNTSIRHKTLHSCLFDISFHFSENRNNSNMRYTWSLLNHANGDY